MPGRLENQAPVADGWRRLPVEGDLDVSRGKARDTGGREEINCQGAALAQAIAQASTVGDVAGHLRGLPQGGADLPDVPTRGRGIVWVRWCATFCQKLEDTPLVDIMQDDDGLSA